MAPGRNHRAPHPPPETRESTRTLAGSPAPLEEQDRAWAISAGRRLRGEFAALIGLLPPHERSASGLQRALGTHRAVAHRLVSAISASDELDVLVRIPGVEGLRNCVAAARHKLGREAEGVLAGADSAIAEFQSLIKACGGSHAKLVARIGAETAGGSPGSERTPRGRRDGVRRAMHDAVRSLTGRTTAARASVSIFRPRPDSPGELEYAHARAYVGYHAAPGAPPLVLSSWVTSAENTSGRNPGMDYRDLRNSPIAAGANGGLLEEFCSGPLPLVASRDTTGRLVQVIDRPAIDTGTPVDAALAYRVPSVGPAPSRLDPPVLLEAVNVVSPVERLVADFYVHKSLAKGCTPSLGLYLGRGTGGCDIIDRWYDQVDGAPVLGLLGPGLGNAHSAAWDRHAELTRHVFEQLGWDPGAFIGYRCEERWPLWHCDYVFALDYRQHAAEDPAS